MPEISRFFGIVVYMCFDDYQPPHFHARYAESEAVIDIEFLTVLAGDLPHRALGMVVEWASSRQHELSENWQRASSLKKLKKIEPLR